MGPPAGVAGRMPGDPLPRVLAWGLPAGGTGDGRDLREGRSVFHAGVFRQLVAHPLHPGVVSAADLLVGGAEGDPVWGQGAVPEPRVSSCESTSSSHCSFRQGPSAPMGMTPTSRPPAYP